MAEFIEMYYKWPTISFGKNTWNEIYNYFVEKLDGSNASAVLVN